MQEDLNEDFLNSYCEKFAHKVAADFFSNNIKKMDGRNIFNLTPCNQVNIFILRQIFRFWQEERKKFESPYFNYNHKDVHTALMQFMNVLSQHIQIEEKELIPLITQALKDSISLCLNPTDFVKESLRNSNESILSEKNIKSIMKYVRIYKEEISSILTMKKGQSLDQVCDELESEMKVIDTTSAFEVICEDLDQIVPFDIEDFFKISDNSHDEENSYDEDDYEEMLKFNSIPNESSEDEKSEQEEDESLESEEDKTHHEENDLDLIPTNHENNPDTVVKEYPLISEESDQEIDIETINTQFKKEEETIAHHISEKNETKDSGFISIISVNQQYMFVNDLFNGNQKEYEKAIDELNRLTSFDAAVKYLITTYGKNYKWNMQSEEVKEFLKVIFRKLR